MSPCRGDESEELPKFRRLLLSPEHLTEELKRVQDGALVRLPAAEFDALVERASRSATKKVAPRLLEARYHAILKEESLQGEGRWKLTHKGPLPGLLNLEPFNLAVKRARFENGDALIAAFDGKNPALLVEATGERTVSLDWSARGESGPLGLQFHLEIPSCPVSLFELDVPVGRKVEVLDDDSLLSGPHEAETAELRRWQIVCGGRQRGERHRVDFRIYAADRPTAPDHPALFVRQKTTEKLHPCGLDAVFELTVDSSPRGIRELVCECDPELRLRDVVGPGVAGYSFQAGASRKPSILAIRLREPVHSGTWQVLCLAPLLHAPVPGGSSLLAWRSPGLRLIGSVSRGETLTLWLDPELRVQSWDAGSFRIDSSMIDRITGSQVLTLVGGGLSPSRRPTAFFQAYEAEFAAHQLTWWRCDAAGMSLTLQIGWDIRTGQLFQLPVQLPTGWSVDKVELTPGGLLRDWHIRKTAGKETLIVDLKSPLSVRANKEKERPAESAPHPAATTRPRLPTLTVHLRPSMPAPDAQKPLDFPDAVPLGARFRQTAVALNCDEQLYHFEVQTTAERAEPEGEGPWGQLLPEYYYRFRGEPVTGTIRVRPRPPRLRARCQSEVFVGAGEAAIETHLLLETEAGRPDIIELALSAGDGEPWRWSTETASRTEDAAINRIRRAERIFGGGTSHILHRLAAQNPLQAVVVAAAQPKGERWRLTLTRPLHVRELLRLRAQRRFQTHGKRWDVPLPVVLGTDRMEGEVMLHLANADLVRVSSAGLREAPSIVSKGITPWRTFRYGAGEVHLALSSQAKRSASPNKGSIERARLVTYVGENGILRHHFSFQMANWSEQTLPLRLPSGSQPWAVRVDGRWLPRLIPSAGARDIETDVGNEGGQPVELALPVPSHGDTVSAKRPHHFEVVYTRTLPAWRFWQSLDAAAPRLPIAPIAFRHVWRLHPKLTPLFHGRYQSLPGTAEAVELSLLPRHANDFFHFPGSLARFDPLQEHQQEADSAGAPQPQQIEFASENIDWREWEPIAGAADERFIVIRSDVVAAIGLGFGFLLGLFFWLLRRRSARLQGTLLFVAVALAGLGVLWLPAGLRDWAWWPLVAGSGAAVFGYLRVLWRKKLDAPSTANQPKNRVATASIAGILVLAILGWPGRAAAPLPVEVYLVPRTAGDAEKQTVLVPTDLLHRLKKLARPAPLVRGGPQAVLVDASYEGQLIDGGKQAEFTAVFSAHSLSEELSPLLLPLSGVQLIGEVLLDGARAAPLALPAPQTGYSVSLRGRGRHKIELTFRTPVIGTAEDRNILFTAPPLVRSRLSWRIPAGAVEPQVLVKNGAQWTARDGSGQRLEADLGAVPLPVQLHWYQPHYPPRLSYRAAYLWDFGVEVNHLTAWLRYRVEQGAVKALTVDLPAELEISSAHAQRKVPDSRQTWLTRFQLRDWHITRAGNKRTLHLEFPYPISGDFQVTLELLPRVPLKSPASLPLPSPLGVSSGGPHYLVYRTQMGLTAQRETSQNLTRIDNKELGQDWLGEPRLDADFQGIAYRIATNQTPKLILRLERIPPVVQSNIDISVRAGAQRAEMEMDAEVQCPDKDLAAIEWQLPPNCSLDEVTGADVRTWKQNGSRLLVWLNGTTTRTRIHLNGWLRLHHREGHPYLELTGLRLTHAGKQYTRLHLAASGEVALGPIRMRNLRSVSVPSREGNSTRRVSEPDRMFETRDLSYQLACPIQTAANAVARVLTLAEVADRQLRFTTTVDYTVKRGELRHVRLRLRNWEEEKVDIQAEQVVLWPGPRRAMGERSWLLPLQPGIRGHYRVTMRGNMPLDKAAVGVSMPEVIVQDVEHADYIVAVAGGELTGQPKGTLESGRSPRQLLQPDWPSAAERVERSGGQAWRVGGAEWQLRLLPHARALEPAPVRVYLLEQSAAVVDGKRWLHEARYWLRHGAYADLHIVFPIPVRVLAASVDGSDVTPIQAGSARVWLPLPGRSGVRSVRLQWFYDPLEALDRPNLSSPQLADAVKGPILDTVRVPPGWQVADHPSTAGWYAGATRAAALALCRADAQLRIVQDLLKKKGDNGVLISLTTAQSRFESYLSQARHALDSGADQDAVAGPQGQSLARWFEELQENNHLLPLPMLDLQTEPSPSPSDFGFMFSDDEIAAGIPLVRQERSNAEPLHLQLISRESQQIRQALVSSGQWLGCLAVAGIIAYVPFFLARLRFFWPEQIALLGLLGWHLAGLTSIVAGLLVIAACSRMVLSLRSLRNLIRRRSQKAKVRTTGNSAAADVAQAS